MPRVKYPFPAIVLAAHTIFGGEFFLFITEEVADLPEQSRDILRMNARIPFGHVVADFVIGETEHRFAALGKGDIIGQQVPIPYAIAAAFQRKTPARFALAQRFLGLLALGDIHRDTDGTDHLALGVAHFCLGDLQLMQLAIRPKAVFR